jgi:probable HAF family extracellular repeat protein
VTPLKRGHFILCTHDFTQESDYTIIDLGLGAAYDLNDRGQVVGYSTTASGETHAFLWKDGVMIDLGTLGGTCSNAYAINRSGQIVGSSTTDSGESHAVLWEEEEPLDDMAL